MQNVWRATVAFESADATRLADYRGISGDLSFCVEACRRLRELLKAEETKRDGVLLRCVWSSALVAYIRCFSTGKRYGLAQEVIEDAADNASKAHLHLLGQRGFLTKDMFRVSCASVMIFQTMMEALINDSLARESKLEEVSETAFAKKWRESLKLLGQDTTAFDEYKSLIYDTFRNPIVHPKEAELSKLDELSSAPLLTGFERGWQAYEQLYSGLGHPHEADSWQVMCEAHGIGQ